MSIFTSVNFVSFIHSTKRKLRTFKTKRQQEQDRQELKQRASNKLRRAFHTKNDTASAGQTGEEEAGFRQVKARALPTKRHSKRRTDRRRRQTGDEAEGLRQVEEHFPHSETASTGLTGEEEVGFRQFKARALPTKRQEKKTDRR